MSTETNAPRRAAEQAAAQAADQAAAQANERASSRRGITLSATGISYRRTPIAVREQMAIATGELGAEVRALSERFPDAELALLATCNRVELYAVTPDGTDPLAPLTELARRRGVPFDELATYHHRGGGAVRHLFAVAAGLDSMVLGENQILGQVKDGYLAAREAGGTGKVLNGLFQESLRVGKTVRSKTRISEGRVSVGSVAVQFARRVFADFSDKTALVLGAGETAELVVQHLFDHGLRDLLVANRSPERGSALVQRYGGQWLALGAAERQLHRAHIVVGSTASPRPIVDIEMMRAAQARRGNQPTLLLDLAVPRDLDPRIAELPGAFLYDIDDLQEVVVENLGRREAEVAAAQRIVDELGHDFERYLSTLDVEPLIAELRGRAESVRKDELRSLFNKLDLTPAQQKQVEKATQRIVNRLLHEPTAGIRQAVEPGRHYAALDVFRALFDLDQQ